MPRKQVSLAKIEFFLSVADRTRVVIEPKRHFWDWPRVLPDYALRLRLTPSLPTLLVLLVVSSLLTSCSSGPLDSSTRSGVQACSGAQADIRPDKGCTIFYAADDDVALAGNNEDYSNPYTYVWFVPPEPGKYGRVYFGYEDGFPQGGVNEKGLFYDGASLPFKALIRPDDKPVYDGVIPRGLLWDKIMSECATVSEALAILDSYSRFRMDDCQLIFGDAGGDSFILEGDTILRKEGSFQLITNFRTSENPDPPYPCWRYTTALDMLSATESFSVELFRDILDATHQEEPGPTLYSNIYDLKNGLIYLYYHHRFKNVVVIDVAAELAKGFHYYRTASLFPDITEAMHYQVRRTNVYATLIAKRPTRTSLGGYTGYAGDYRVGQAGETMRIYMEADRLYFQQRFSLPIELVSETEDHFFHVFHDGNELTIKFDRDVQGDVSGATGVLFGTGELIGEEFLLERLIPAPVSAQPTSVPDEQGRDQYEGLLRIPYSIHALSGKGCLHIQSSHGDKPSWVYWPRRFCLICRFLGFMAERN